MYCLKLWLSEALCGGLRLKSTEYDHCGFAEIFRLDLSNQDVFVNVSGGLKIKESGCDLAIMKAIISSYKKIPNKLDCIYLGECSLTGKIKQANLFELRKNEMQRLAYKISNQI